MKIGFEIKKILGKSQEYLSPELTRNFQFIVYCSLHSAYNNTDQRFTRTNGVNLIEKKFEAKTVKPYHTIEREM